MGHYNVGQVCLNGHEITSDFEGSPELRADFCSKCGERTVHSCENCHAAIRGDYHVETVISFFPWNAPAFCHACGKPFEWTTRRIAAAQALAEEAEDVDRDTVDKAKASFLALTSDTPETGLAIVRVKKLLKAAAPAVGDAIRAIIVSVATDAAKKSLGL